MLNSLIGRLMTFSTLALVLLTSGLGLLLERSFYASQLRGMQQHLKLHSYSILSLAEFQNNQLYLPVFMQERRFNQPGSGLYAQVIDQQFNVHWSSLSARQLPVSDISWARQGEWLYSTVQRGDDLFLLARFGVSWSQAGKPGPVFNVLLMDSLAGLQQQVAEYRKTLIGLLVGLAVFILLVQYLILRWGLRPLRQVSNELGKVQHGEQAELDGIYPRELQPLTSNLNHLLLSERSQRERYRNTMADLSHSLKTPLAVMTGIVRARQQQQNTAELNELSYQLDKMASTIAYQLKRSASQSSQVSIQRLPVLPLLQSVCSAMDKVYAHKAMQIHLDVDDSTEFRGDENDLLEVIGNLIDNACKYGRSTVEIAAYNDKRGFILNVCDDGPGIPAEKIDTVLQRGQRLDTVEAGQGLGLALVKEIIDAYRAELTIEQSPLGGACFRIEFPFSVSR